MKKIAILALTLISIYSCGNSNEFKVVASLQGVKDGTEILVKKLAENNRLIVIDTLQVKGEKFSYRGISEIPEMNYFYVEGIKGSLRVIIEPGKINIIAYKDSINASVIEGTPYNDDFGRLTVEFKKLGLKNRDLRTRMFKTSQEKDSAAIPKLRKEYQTLQQENLDIQNNFIKENPQSYVAAILLKQYALTSKNIDIEELQRMYDTLPKLIKKTKEAREVAAKLYKLSRTAIGTIAPEFSGPNPEGEILALKDIKGKVTIIDFRAAWCQRCRTESPNLVALYNKYHDKGLNIISVSLDKTAEEWKQAITEDSLPWHHVSNVKYWQDPIAKKYNLRDVPANFILDAQGKIAAKNLTGEALESKIKALLEL